MQGLMAPGFSFLFPGGEKEGWVVWKDFCLPGSLTWKGAVALALGWNLEPIPGQLLGSSPCAPSLEAAD